MSDSQDTMNELAAGYALGALSTEEVRTFEEHLTSGCTRCKAELASFEAVAGSIALSVESEMPPIYLKDRLLQSLTQDFRGLSARAAKRVQELVSIRAGEGSWTEVQTGVLVKKLFVDEVNEIATSLVRMLPGTSLPVHRHLGVEQFYVIEGDCHVHGEILGPGDYHRAQSGSVHETTYTEGGTLFLLVAPARYEVITGSEEPRKGSPA